MAYIKVDPGKFYSTAAEIQSYIRFMKNQMRMADIQVLLLLGGWEGEDHDVWLKQWDKVTEEGSTYDEMIEVLEAYADFLKFAAKKYREAQKTAVDQAYSLQY